LIPTNDNSPWGKIVVSQNADHKQGSKMDQNP
jgi:hypothetical protein